MSLSYDICSNEISSSVKKKPHKFPVLLNEFYYNFDANTKLKKHYMLLINKSNFLARLTFKT